MKKKGIKIVGGLLILAAIGAGGWYYYRNVATEVSEENIVYVTEIRSLTGEASGVENRYAGVVEAQETKKVKLENGRTVKEVQVEVGDTVSQGQLLFEYDLTAIQQDLEEAQLELERLQNESKSITEQIARLEKEKKSASSDNQLSYTIEIETNRLNLKKNEYNQKSKQAEIDKLNNATLNTEVRSEIDGVVQSIDTTQLKTDDVSTMSSGNDYMYYQDESQSQAFITILSTGAYRIKGMVNEQNAQSIITGEPVIVRSRVDENQIWYGMMGNVDRENASQQNNMNYGYGMASTSDSQTMSSSYPFYVELDSSDGLMLGQHVYIERNDGQGEEKIGIWLDEYYIVDADTAEPYVWAANEKDRLEKRPVILGQYDSMLCQYEIADGLTEDDCIAFPQAWLEEGLPTKISNDMQGYTQMDAQMDSQMDASYYDPEMTGEELPVEEGMMDGMDAESWTDSGEVLTESDAPDASWDMSGAGSGEDLTGESVDPAAVPDTSASGSDGSGAGADAGGSDASGEFADGPVEGAAANDDYYNPQYFENSDVVLQPVG